MYGVSAAAYLARARQALQSGEQRSLFYAAFELRSCIEARQAEYVQALLAYKKTKIKPWNIGENGRRIRSKSYANKLAKVTYYLDGVTAVETFHTPVTDSLLTFAEQRLGGLLHSQATLREDADPWWEETRRSLIEGYRLAWLACQGDSMTPPMWNTETGAVHPVQLEKAARNSALFERLDQLVGAVLTVNVAYLDAPPVEWICDL